MGTSILSDAELWALLNDDVPCGDLTTETLTIGSQAGRLQFCARQPMTVCGSEDALRLFELTGASTQLFAHTGSVIAAGTVILEAHGTAARLHIAWKTAQTLVEWASGIATATAAIVAVAGGAAVACTRKNVPGTKTLSAKAVQAGGGIMHRLGLSETLLMFAEHRIFLSEPPHQTIQRMRSTQPEKKIVVEVSTLEEARLWADAGADVLQLEKFTPESVANCRVTLEKNAQARRPMLAAAGGIRAENAAAYVAAGADFLVTSSPYTAAPRDVQVNFKRVDL